MASFLNQNFDDDEESENEFNPNAAGGSDAGSNRGDSDGEADGIAEKPPTDNRNRQSPDPRRSRNGDSATPPTSNRRRIDDEAEEVQDDDEDGNADHGEDDEGEGEDLGEDDEEEDDDEDEDGIRSRPNKRRKRGLNQFFEEEAEVDDDDDELGDDEEGVGEFVDEAHPDDDLPAEADQDDRRHRELDRKRQLEASMDAEKQAQEFKERYGRRTTTALSSGSFVPQNLLMPDINDPSIWAVRCREGKEKEIISRLMKKFQEAANHRKPLGICSAFERGDGPMKGFIFVEAKQKAAVVEAFDGVPDAYPRTNPKLIPVKEMPDLLRVNKSKELTIDSYVRIRRGLYQNDLGVVEDAATNGLEATIRLVPRLTYGLDDEEQARVPQPGVDANGKRKRPFAPPVNMANRPPARFFNENEAKKKHARFLQPNRTLTGKAFTYKGDEYEDGFLIKDFKIQHLITDNVQPKLEETQRFTRTGQDGAETLDLETLKKSLHDNANAESSYQVGDEVEVFNGEQRGIIGRTERVAGGIVSLKVSEGDLSGQMVEIPVKDLRKRFREGDNVVVVGGSKYRDQVGTVLMIQDDKVTILPQDSQDELTVFSKDLREASGVGGSSERSKFDVRDLIQLTATTFGCVVGADPQTVRIMNQQGSIETRLPSSISKIEESRNAVAVDKNGSEIRPGDSVRETGGEGKSGSILHLYRGYLFAHDRTRMVENAGIWVARCTNVISRGGASRNGAPTTDLTKMNPAMLMKDPNGNMAPPQRPGMDRLIKKTVKIIRGPYKGHRGIVKDTTANSEARIELESKNKVVNIPKEQLSILEYVNCISSYRAITNSLQPEHRHSDTLQRMDLDAWRSPSHADGLRKRSNLSYPQWWSHSDGWWRWWTYSSMGSSWWTYACMGRSR